MKCTTSEWEGYCDHVTMVKTGLKESIITTYINKIHLSFQWLNYKNSKVNHLCWSIRTIFTFLSVSDKVVRLQGDAGAKVTNFYILITKTMLSGISCNLTKKKVIKTTYPTTRLASLIPLQGIK